MSIEIKANGFIVGSFSSKKATIAQNSSATDSMKAGTLLYLGSDGKMSATKTDYPICALLSDIDADTLKAGDVTTSVVYNAKLDKKTLEEVNDGLTIDDLFIWNCLKNGLDIVEYN